MSKIICDICGTSYPETAKQCPICGCVRPGDVQRVTNEVKSDGKVSTGYTYVKGGRFSKSNVKKRTHAQTHSAGAAKNPTSKNNNVEEKDNRGLVITAIVLLLAIIGVVVYIAIRYFGPISDPNDGTSTPSTTLGNQVDLSCTNIILDTDTLVFEQAGEARLLSVTVEPKNTPDAISFRSEDEAVVTVNEVGKVTVVGEGTTNIIITCGKVTKQCAVTVQFPEESSSVEATVDTSVPDESSKPQETLRLNRQDITFSSKDDSWVLYNGEIAKNLITWSSDDETVATFADGTVEPVGNGMTTVHAEYEGQKVSCIIRCSFQESSGVVGNGGVSEDGGGTAGNGGVSEDGGNAGGTADSTTYAIYTVYGKADDITISVGATYTLSLKDSSGNAVNATWASSSSAIAVSGNTITGVSRVGEAKVTATYNGKTYECIVRVG